MQFIIILAFCFTFILIASAIYFVLFKIIDSAFLNHYKNFPSSSLRLFSSRTKFRVNYKDTLIKFISIIRCSRGFYHFLLFFLAILLLMAIDFGLSIHHGVSLFILTLVIGFLCLTSGSYLFLRFQRSFCNPSMPFSRIDMFFPITLIFLPTISIVFTIHEGLHIPYLSENLLWFAAVLYFFSWIYCGVWMTSRASFFSSRELYEIYEVPLNIQEDLPREERILRRIRFAISIKRVWYSKFMLILVNFALILKKFQSRSFGTENTQRLYLGLKTVRVRTLLAQKNYIKVYRLTSKLMNKYSIARSSGAILNIHLSCLIWMGLYYGASHFIDRFQLQKSENPHIHLTIAELLRNEGDYEGAINKIKSVQNDCLMKPIELIRLYCEMLMKDIDEIGNPISTRNSIEIANTKRQGIVDNAEKTLEYLEKLIVKKGLQNTHYPAINETKARVLLAKSAMAWNPNSNEGWLEQARDAGTLLLKNLLNDFFRPESHLLLAYLLAIGSLRSNISSIYNIYCVKTLCPWPGNKHRIKAIQLENLIRKLQENKKILTPKSFFYLYTDDPFGRDAWLDYRKNSLVDFNDHVFGGLKILDYSIESYLKDINKTAKVFIDYYFRGFKQNNFSNQIMDVLRL